MTINLKQLTGLFAQTASNEKMPGEIRQFAAQLTVLTRHMHQESELRQLQDQQLAELAKLMLVFHEKVEGKSPATTAPQPSVETVREGVDADSEEEAAKQMAEQVMRETEAEVAAAKNTAPITPSRKPGNGTVEAAS